MKMRLQRGALFSLSLSLFSLFVWNGRLFSLDSRVVWTELQKRGGCRKAELQAQKEGGVEEGQKEEEEEK